MTNQESNRAGISKNLRSLRNIVLKTILLFFLANLVFAACFPMTWLGKLTAYNFLFPGRQRLPYADNPTRAYSLSLNNLEAMFASHELDGTPKPSDEFRVLLIGDSSTWGFLLPKEQTLSAYLNQAAVRIPDNRRVRVYNLGYPVMSLTKDLLILSIAMRYQPDLIVWPVTLESFPYDKQLFSPLLQNNRSKVVELISDYQLAVDPESVKWNDQNWFSRTLLGARRPLADLLRLQLFGILWAATGIDQEIPDRYIPRQEDLTAEVSFHNLQPPHLQERDLAFDVLAAGIEMAGNVPVLLVNEPIFISEGKNSDIRYNFYYPRWAYDDYRALIARKSEENGWNYLDLWDAIPPNEFTNTAVHLTPKGTSIFAQRILEVIFNIANQSPLN